jgi:hypothetical protein
MQVKQFNPAEHEVLWNSFVAKHPETTPYHTRAWAGVIKATFRFEEKSIVCFDENGELKALLPLWQVNYKTLNNAPWRDKADMLYLNEASRNATHEYISKISADMVLKDWSSCSPGNVFKPVQYWISSVVDISMGRDALWAKINKSVGRNIRKAETSGIVIKEELSSHGVEKFYYLFKMTRKRLGVPIYPRFFFENMISCLSPESLRIYIAYLNDKPICGYIILDTHLSSIYAYGASDFAFQATRMNDLVMWRAMADSIERGKKYFDFGCDSPDSENILRFKRKWGAIQRPMTTLYKTKQTIDPAKEDLSSKHHVFQRRVFSRMPDWMLVFIGKIATSHWITYRLPSLYNV